MRHCCLNQVSEIGFFRPKNGRLLNFTSKNIVLSVFGLKICLFFSVFWSFFFLYLSCISRTTLSQAWVCDKEMILLLYFFYSCAFVCLPSSFDNLFGCWMEWYIISRFYQCKGFTLGAETCQTSQQPVYCVIVTILE